MRHGIRSALVAVAAALAACAGTPGEEELDAAREAARGYRVEILRDAWGVPHVYGERDADVAFGVAYAQSEDDFSTLQEVLLATRGRLARVKGPDAAPVDYLVAFLGFWEAVEAGYDQLPASTRALAEAYAAGANLYAARHPDELLAGVFPVTGRDIVAGFALKTPLFYGLDKAVKLLFSDRRPEEALARGWQPEGELLAGWRAAGVPFGSNAIAVAPGRSSDGATRLVVNSHQPYTGPVAWYEVRLHSEEGLDVAGGVFPGSPVILHGHNRHLGWASTVNRPDLVDLYRLELHPEDPDRYRFDGDWRRLERETVEIPVRLPLGIVWTFEREVLRSVHGPVVRGEHGAYALRYPLQDEIGHLTQLHRMSRARNLDEWMDAMRLRAMPSINYVYADRDGHVAYLYNAALPRRSPGYDWGGVLPGDTSETLWTELLPFERLPRVLDPPSGFVINSNHTPWRATLGPGNPDPASLPPEVGIETRMTNRALRALELLGADESIGPRELRRIKYDKRYSRESGIWRTVQELLARDFSDEPRLARAQEVLARWGGGTRMTDSAAALAVLTTAPAVRAREEGTPPPDPVESFREAVALLEEHHGRLDPPWRAVNRLRRGAVDLPLGGAPDVLRAVYGEPDGDGRLMAKAGDTFVMFATWDRDGALRSESIHQFGSATLDEGSRHYADQAPVFAAEETKRVLLDRETLERRATRRYRPAESP